MSHDTAMPKDFQERVIRLLDGDMSDDEFVQFNELMTAHPELVPHYLNALADYMALTKMGHMLPLSQTTQKRIPYSAQELISLLDLDETFPESTVKLHFEPGISADERKRRIETYAQEQLQTFLQQQHPPVPPPRMAESSWSFDRWFNQAVTNTLKTVKTSVRLFKIAAALALITMTLCLVCLVAYSNRTVAQIIETVEARWNVPLQVQAKLRPRRLRLEEGFARIRLNRGSEIILQAPSTIEFKNDNQVMLESGWLTAHVPPQASGFTVETPWSKVVDYGTEFGLITGNSMDTQLHVLKGEVGLQTLVDEQKPRQHLLAGQCAIQNRYGETSLSTLEDHTHLFIRTLPSDTILGFPGRRLNLADVVGGGNGFGSGLPGQGFDPSSGQITVTAQLLNSTAKEFQNTNSSLFVDGVFIPDSSLGTQIITSTGISFKQCPDTSGLCRESIRYGASYHRATFQNTAGSLGNEVFEPNHPCIGMHANAGITFDLQKIRSSMSEVWLKSFSTRCGLPSTETNNPSFPVQVWILLDGQVKFSQQLTDPSSQPYEILIELNPRQRFLSLAVTTLAEYDETSMAIFDQPILTLTP